MDILSKAANKRKFPQELTYGDRWHVRYKHPRTMRFRKGIAQYFGMEEVKGSPHMIEITYEIVGYGFDHGCYPKDQLIELLP